MGKKSGKKKAMIKNMSTKERLKWMLVLFSLIFVLAIIILTVVYKVFSSYVNQFPEDTIVNNVYVGGNDLSGMTEKEAKSFLKDRLAAGQEAIITISLKEEEIEKTLGELGISYKDLDATVKKAVEYGKAGSLWNRYFRLQKLKKQKKVFREDLILDNNKSKILFEEMAADQVKEPVSAAIKRKNGKFVIVDGVAGDMVNADKMIGTITQILNDKWDYKTFSIDAVIEKEEPYITKKDLETIQDLLGEFSTDAGDGDRWTNLKVGVGKLDGTVLMPGEKLSLNEATGPYDETSDYVAAGAYENGQKVQSLGGGICQVTSTLYNAVLYAELEVVERSSHSLVVSYVEPARDAAIAEGYMDFVIRNNYETPIYIEAEITDSNQLYFGIYGKETRNPDRVIEYKSELLSEEEPKVIYEADYNQPVGYFATTQFPFKGESAVLWKGVSEKGGEMKWEEMHKSYYQKVDQIISVGVDAGGAPSNAVLSAISTQDYDTIAGTIGGGY